MSAAGGQVSIVDRFDITLEAVERVAWHGRRVALDEAAIRRMDAAAKAFDDLVAARVRADPQALIYGVTSAPGDGAAAALDPEAQARRPTRLWTAMSYGEPLPDRVTRAIALARLANFLGGHAGARARVAAAIVEMLNGGEPLPVVPSQSNGGSGEILPLGTLFYDLSCRLELAAKERMALINGSPCASALIADAALAGRARLQVAEQLFALIAEITGAPREHFAADLEELWGDEHEAAALRSLRTLLGDPAGQQSHQAAVSLRILPRVLGAARRAQAEAERAAEVSLRAVTDNPVFLPPSDRHPEGAVYSTGGYHNSQAAPAIDALAFAHADLCQLSEQLCNLLFRHPDTADLVGGDEWSVKPLHMSITGWAEEARASAGPTLLSLGSFGQNDVPELAFLAWRKAQATSRCLDGALAGLGVLASQVLHRSGRPGPEPLRALVDAVRAIVPAVDEPRPLGVECQRLYERMTDGATGGVPFL